MLGDHSYGGRGSGVPVVVGGITKGVPVASGVQASRYTASTSAPLAAPTSLIKSRRFMESAISHLLRSLVDRGTDSLIRPAAAEYVAHGRVDLRICWPGIFLQQGRRVHDLTGLAVAALRDAFLNPRLLQRVCAIRGQPFNRRNIFP